MHKIFPSTQFDAPALSYYPGENHLTGFETVNHDTGNVCLVAEIVFEKRIYSLQSKNFNTINFAFCGT